MGSPRHGSASHDFVGDLSLLRQPLGSLPLLSFGQQKLGPSPRAAVTKDVGLVQNVMLLGTAMTSLVAAETESYSCAQACKVDMCLERQFFGPLR